MEARDGKEKGMLFSFINCGMLFSLIRDISVYFILFVAASIRPSQHREPIVQNSVKTSIGLCFTHVPCTKFIMASIYKND